MDAFIEALSRGENICFAPIMIVAAHPDDETVGMGSRLPLVAKSVTLLHVTDGSPRNMSDANAAGFQSRGEYAEARRRELYAALSIAGIDTRCCCTLNIPDQEAGFRLVEVACGIMEMMRKHKPCAVFTHPYEGGHPDHDSTAFGVHSAIQIMETHGEETPVILEFASYHRDAGGMSVFEFLEATDCTLHTAVLSREERALKKNMLAQFVSQQRTLALFPVDIECFRKAPVYDFSLAPHPGLLYYDLFPWGMRGQEWREQARAARETLGLGDLIHVHDRTQCRLSVRSGPG